jgi:ADP-ribose pyrophosphatase YjhB (NUDIX family)
MGGVTGDTFRHDALGVVFQVREGRLAVLLWQRGEQPFLGAWALPGGRLLATERLGTSASRHLAAKVDISEIAHLEQLETRSDPVRDPRGRVLATAYLALVTVGAQPRLPADTAWHPVESLPLMALDLGYEVSATNLQRILTRRGVIEATSQVAAPAAVGGRPATMYRFASRSLVITNPFAAFRPRSGAAS